MAIISELVQLFDGLRAKLLGSDSINLFSFETWAPTLTTDAGTIANVVLNQAQFRRDGQTCHVDFDITFDLSVAVASFLYLTAPSDPVIIGNLAYEFFGHGSYYNGNEQVTHIDRNFTNNSFRILRPNGATFAIATGIPLKGKFRYQITGRS